MDQMGKTRISMTDYGQQNKYWYTRNIETSVVTHIIKKTKRFRIEDYKTNDIQVIYHSTNQNFLITLNGEKLVKNTRSKI